MDEMESQEILYRSVVASLSANVEVNSHSLTFK